MKSTTMLLLFAGLVWSQSRYDLLLKQGHVIDPANRIDGVMDIAVAGGKIARVAANIPAGEARKVIDAQGLYVTPGLIDLHAHVGRERVNVGYDQLMRIIDQLNHQKTEHFSGGSVWR